jgi:predicted membrane channel-forming protein YqfA (hemolysin III family)
LLSNRGLNPFLWTTLFLGAAGVLVFSYLFAFKSAGAQAAMTGLLAFSLGLVLYLIAVMDYPYRGDVRIQATPFVEARQMFREIGY